MTIIYDLDEADYFSSDALSSTEARLILESPAKYRWKKDHPPLIAPSKKFDVGSAIHTMTLGTGYEAIPIPAEYLASNGAASTTAAKTFIAETRAIGKIPLKLEEFEPIRLAAESLMKHPAAKVILEQAGHPEVSVFSTDPETDVACRARIDFLPDLIRDTAPSRVGADVKSTIDASPQAFEKAIANYGYDVQWAHYTDTLGWETGEEAELVFCAVEKEAPYLVGVYQLPTIWKQMGRTKAREARRLYAEAMESGVWPGYSDNVELLSPPNWLIYQHEERFPND